MAGCFGNSPIDRWIEHDLYRYLNDCADYESLCEKICEKIPNDLWDLFDNHIDKVLDYVATKVERGKMEMIDAQVLLCNFVIKMAESGKWQPR